MPAVFRARTAREFQALNRDPDPVPTALREFRRTDRLLIRFERVGARNGCARSHRAPAEPHRVRRCSTCRSSCRPRATPYYQIDLPLAGFAAGDYLVEVTAQSGESKVTELVAMHVTG